MSAHANGLMPMLRYIPVANVSCAGTGSRLLLLNPVRANEQQQDLPVEAEREIKRRNGLPVCLHDFEKHSWIELI